MLVFYFTFNLSSRSHLSKIKKKLSLRIDSLTGHFRHIFQSKAEFNFLIFSIY